MSSAALFAAELKAGDRVLLEGPMGAGKSTFARAVLQALGVRQAPEGSPTFALAHEYDAALGRVAHVDFYRIKVENEIEDAGLAEHFWDREKLVLAEWTSLWPGFLAALERPAAGHRTWLVSISMVEGEPLERGLSARILSSIVNPSFRSPHKR